MKLTDEELQLLKNVVEFLKYKICSRTEEGSMERNCALYDLQDNGDGLVGHNGWWDYFKVDELNLKQLLTSENPFLRNFAKEKLKQKNKCDA